MDPTARTVHAHDPVTGATFPITVATPAEGDGPFPLVVVSHGSGGSPFTHRGLVAYLAAHGFIVAAPEHPRNNRDRNDLAGTAELLENRPRELRLTIDAMLDACGDRVRQDAVAVVGHSIGGYTALALAGGRPGARAHETPDRTERRIDITPDPRIRAIVLLAPATPWFMFDGALRDVRVPILMLTGAADAQAPAFFGEVVKHGVGDPSLVTHRVVPNAGHYSFLAPFPPERTRPDFPPSQDPPGFDRVAFHAELYPEIAAFVRSVL